jgi:hypothetical protein
MSDAVRLPMAAKMKERALAAILAQMPADDAKDLTEKLANRVSGAQTLADARTALNPPAQTAAQAQAGAPGQTASATPAAGKPHRAARHAAGAQAAAQQAPAAGAAPPVKAG